MPIIPRKAFWALWLVPALLAASLAYASESVPGQVIVKYREGIERSRKSMIDLYRASGVKKIYRFKGLMRGFEQLQLEEGVKVEDAIAELMNSGLVEYAQPNYILRLPQAVRVAGDENPIPGLPRLPCIPGFEIPNCDPNYKPPCLIPGIPFPPGCDDGGGGENPPNPTPSPRPPSERPPVGELPPEVDPPVADPNLAKAYGIEKVQAPKAWERTRGTKSFIVAVIDTGTDYNHEDLAGNMWRNPDPSRNNDLVGYDFIHNDGLPFDDNGHGTHTAGTVGAVGGNGKGVSGVTQRVSIMALKFLSSEGSGTTADAIKAIDYAIEHGAKVLSNSWGGKGDEDNKALYEAIERAKAKDVLFIAAAGNDGTNNDGNDPSYPAAFDNDNLIAVAATDKSDDLAFFSNYGKVSTDLAAPGVNVYSTSPGNRYVSHSGTSMACPHVAGAAALVWSAHPDWSYKQVKSALLSAVDPVSSLQGKVATGGRLNVLKALSR